MSTRTIRVTVRGSFDALTDEQRAELAAHQAEHDFLTTTYTREGHLSYEIAARPFFTFRYGDTVESEDEILAVTARAESVLAAWMESRGYGYKDLKSTAQDLSVAPMGARGRRERR